MSNDIAQPLDLARARANAVFDDPESYSLESHYLARDVLNVLAEVARLSGELETARAEAAEPVRVVVVVDWERHRVHSITADNEYARQQTRELAKGRKSWDAATMTVDLVYPQAAPAVVSGTSQAAADDEWFTAPCVAAELGVEHPPHVLSERAGVNCAGAVPGTGEQAAPTWRGMPISACGLKPSHAHHVYDNDGTKTVCMGSLFTLDGAPSAFLKAAADAAPAPTPAEGVPTAHQHWVGDRTYRWCHLTHCAEAAGTQDGGASRD